MNAATGGAGNGAGDRGDVSHVIVVNGRQKTVFSEDLAFSKVVALADNLLSGPGVVYTVNYKNGPANKPQGSIVDGESVMVTDGMVFSVTATNKS